MSPMLQDDAPGPHPGASHLPATAKGRHRAVVVLAAGKGTRMRSHLPKVLHRLAGRCLLDHVLDLALRRAEPEDVVVVVGHQAGDVVAHVAPHGVRTVLQEPQLGTGDALRVGLAELAAGGGADPETVLVLSGDVPLLRTATIDLLESGLDRATDAVLLTALLDEPGTYGRVIRRSAEISGPIPQYVSRAAKNSESHPREPTSGESSFEDRAEDIGEDIGEDIVEDIVEAIIEARDADQATLAVREVNAGVYAFRHEALVDAIGDLRPDNAQGEYYLTDLVAALGRRGRVVRARAVDDADEMLGVNTRHDLAHLGRLLNQRILEQLLEAGVTIVDPRSTWIEVDCQVEADVVLEPGVVLKRGARVGAGAIVGAGSVIDGTDVAPGEQVPPLTLRQG